MNIYDTFIECYDNNEAYLNDEEIMDYFKSMVNNEFLNQESYNLIILNEQTIYKKYLYYDVLSKTFYFNKYIFQKEFYLNNRNSNNMAFDYNLAILNLIHEILAKIDLERKIYNDIFYKNNPIFYKCFIEEQVSSNEKNLKNNFLTIKKAQYLNNFLNNLGEHEFIKKHKISLDSFIKNYLIDFYDKNLLKNTHSPRHHKNTIPVDICDFEKRIIIKYDLNIFQKYQSCLKVDKIEKTSLLDSMLYGKKFSNEEKEILQDKNINILDYANNEIIRRISKKLNLKK